MLLANCTFTESYNRDGDLISRQIHVGPTIIKTPDETFSLRHKGVGLLMTLRGASIGYFDENWAVIRHHCISVIEVRNLALLEAVKALVADLDQTCVIIGD